VIDANVRPDELVSRLRERGYRLTPQRMAVLRILAASDGHPGVEQIYAKVKADFPMTSLATVYKTVRLLKEMGEVLELRFSDDCNRYDGNRPYLHAHLICTQCKKIVDPVVPDLAILPEEVGKRTGFQILGHRLDFYGICEECQKKQA
jgi:Fur family peroxide stress response transcriptional regulator